MKWLEVGTALTSKWLEVGTVRTFQRLEVGTYPTFKQLETKLALHEAKIVAMESRFLVVELERNTLAEKVKIIEEKNNNHEDKIVWLEDDVEIGTEKAVEDYKENLGENMHEKEEGEEDVAVYRVEEWKDDEVEDKEEMVDQLQQQYDKWNEKDRVTYSYTQNLGMG